MDNGRWTFELLTPETHDATRSLILAGLAEHWGDLDPALNRDLDDMLASYGDGVTIVAVADAPPAGRVIATGTILSRTPWAVEIVRMSVDRSLRRSGLGRAVVAELVDHATRLGADSIVLETSSAWTEAVSFYLACGFEITHTEPSPFGEDTWFQMDLPR